MSLPHESRPPLSPFTQDTARQKVRLAEDAWNSRDPQRVALACSVETPWRHCAEFPLGRIRAQALLERKWARELDYRLIKALWAHDGHRIAGRIAFEWHDDAGHGFRYYPDGHFKIPHRWPPCAGRANCSGAAMDRPVFPKLPIDSPRTARTPLRR
jgi:nuclear transport factor 2 (NTF2) superfamily protein